MIQRVVQTPAFTWLDATNPTPEELSELTKQYALHPSSVQDCLEPMHLPKYERIGATVFLIVRAYDEDTGPDADSAQKLTRKVAVFIQEHLVLTIHRKGQRYLTELRAATPADAQRDTVLYDLLHGVLQSYRAPLEDAETQVAHFEEHLFENEEVADIIRSIHLLKRRVTVIRWMVRRTQELLQELKPLSEKSAPALRDVLDRAAGLYFAADELLDDVNNLLNVQLSLAAHRTSEVMRVLTIFSVFFMPLTFIVGIYGMNFEHMPELKWRWGYGAAMGLMACASLGIFLWFRRKGWMK